MLGSDDPGAADGVAVEVALGEGAGPAISVESVSRRYERLRFVRTRRLFAVFGGIETDVGGIDEEDEDDDVDAEAGEEVEARVVDRTLALNAATLRLTGAGCVAFVGPPRSGKSVLMRTIAGLAPPSAGRVVVEGLLVPVFGSLAVLFPREAKTRRALPVLAALLRLPVSEVRSRLPQILEFLGDDEAGNLPISSFSAKRRQELLFATMLSLDPDIILVDCPFPPGAFGERCRERLCELKDGGTLVVVAAGDVEGVAWIADHVVYMKQGRIVGAESLDAWRMSRPPIDVTESSGSEYEQSV
jgi:ABC-type polysaccharide/polyol phosphate transport system ATPase subunit